MKTVFLLWNLSISSFRSRKSKLTAVGIRCADHATPLSAKIGINFADKRRSLGRYSSLAGLKPQSLFISSYSKRYV
jgi:hypothetical protein